MAQLFTNNAATTLDGAIDDTTTTIVVTDGTVFPTPTGGDYFHITIVAVGGTGKETAWEIVKCTGRAGNSLTVERGREGTANIPWADNVMIELRITAAQAEGFANHEHFKLVATGNDSAEVWVDGTMVMEIPETGPIALNREVLVTGDLSCTGSFTQRKTV
jgi:hypothetical protein